MARKAYTQEEAKADWSVINQWTLSRAYGPYRAQGAVPKGTLVIVTHLQSSSEHPLMDAAPLLRPLLDETDYPMPPLVLLMDLSRLAQDEDAMTAMLMAEGASPGFSKGAKKSKGKAKEDQARNTGFNLGKAVARALEKLHLKNATIVASGPACQLLLKILYTGERLPASAWARLLLLHPALPVDTVNGLLSQTAASGASKGFAQTVPVDIVFKSDAHLSKRLEAVRSVFPLGSASVLPPCADMPTSEAALALTVQALVGDSSAEEEEKETHEGGPAPLDRDDVDSQGRALWMGELQVVMSPDTKQHVHEAEDLTEEIHDLWQSEARAAAAEEARLANEATAGATANGPSLAGALVLRGSRCVLVRSLQNPPAWRGMKLPAVPRMKAAEAEAAIAAVVDSVEEDATAIEAAEAAAAAAAAAADGGDAMESFVDGGIRAFSTLCAIDGPGEVIPLADVPPVMVHGNGHPHGQVLLHLYYAAMPPPPGPLEDADMEDEDDDYDWYTFPRAMQALPDEASRIALQTAALALHAAAAAGKVPAKWRASEGGIFGQELFVTAGGLAGAAMLGAAGGGTAKKVLEPEPEPEPEPEQESEPEPEEEEEQESCPMQVAEADMEIDIEKLKEVVYGLDLEALQGYATDLGIPLTAEQGQKKSQASLVAEVWEELSKRHSKQEHNEHDHEHDHEHCGHHDAEYDTIIVGAGASGVGMAIMLIRNFGLDPKRVLLVERGTEVGETFRLWPREMRFISPSFNQQGWTSSFDLNSVAYGTSPAHTLHAEHPTGQQYARYLCDLAEQWKLRVWTTTEVTAIKPQILGGFEVEVVEVGPAGAAPKTLQTPYVVWAAGEFQYPRASTPLFPGSDLCLHNSSVRSWKELPGDDFVVIGGYESGMDASFNLASCGKRCTVVSSTAFWQVCTEDPSTELAPYTAERVRKANTMPTPPSLLAPLRVFKVETLEDPNDGYLVHARWGAQVEYAGGKHRDRLQTTGSVDGTGSSDCAEGSEISLRTPQPPVLCAGFEGSVVAGVAVELFQWGKGGDDGADGCAAGSPLLNAHDESTITPGLFLAGPAVRHGSLSFCFVYKFRQRFAIVADAIARGLGRDTTDSVQECRDMDMFLDDFECCKSACGDAC